MAEAMQALVDMPRPAWLDSSRGADGMGRYSYATADPLIVVRARGREVCLSGPAGTRRLTADPFQVLRGLLAEWAVPHNPLLPPFMGGFIGAFGYDLGRVWEDLPSYAVRDSSVYDLDVAFYDWVLAEDHLTGQCQLIADEASADTAVRRLARLRTSSAGPGRDEPSTPAAPRFRSNVTRAAYLDAIRAAQAAIAAGEIYQVNLSHRLEAPWSGPLWPLYRRLRQHAPVPYGAYLDLGEGGTVLSASPERFLRLDGRHVSTRPIKGTRPRTGEAAHDAVQAEALLSSAKDRAENLMIVDLLRNDLGKVCEIGSVRAPDLFRLEPHPGVWHLVSTVEGTLRLGLDALDLLQAALPGGSVTGCPKLRSMEIIEALEPVGRGLYCGALGYLSRNGSLDSSIVIRTLVHADDRLTLSVGGAVLADSDPAAEYAETLTKAQAALAALGAQLDFDGG